MAGGIFISYRREDARHAAGRLYQHLAQRFRGERLFMDVDSIEPGLDFVKVLTKTVADCDVLLAVIGPGWLDSRDEAGAPRLAKPKDFVRLEIEAALARDIRVVPVLVDGARMPGEDDLPESLRPLVTRNAVRLAHEQFGADAGRLADMLTKVVAVEPAKSGWFGGWGKQDAGAGEKAGESHAAKSDPVAAKAPTQSKPRVEATAGLATPRMAPPSQALPPMPAPAFLSGALADAGSDPLGQADLNSPAALDAPANRRPLVIAITFAMLAWPVATWLTVLLGNVMDNWWSFQVHASVIVATIVFALFHVRMRGPALTGMEAALFWFGCVLTLKLLPGALWFISMAVWHGEIPADNGNTIGVLIMVLLTMASAFVASRFRRCSDKIPISIYWVGVCVILSGALRHLDLIRLDGAPHALLTAAFILAPGVALFHRGWADLTSYEAGIYSFGLALAIYPAIGTFFRADTRP